MPTPVLQQSSTQSQDDRDRNANTAEPIHGHRTTFKALDGLRFLAAIAVVLFHYSPQVSHFGDLPKWTRSLIMIGPLAVPFFYVLSGFVLAHVYRQTAHSLMNRKWDFWRARIARIYPAYLFAFLLFAPQAFVKYLFHPNHGGPSGLAVFAWSGSLYCAMLQSWTSLSQAWNGPGWSVSVEAFFYFLFPWLLGMGLTAKSQRSALLCRIVLLIPIIVTWAHLTHRIPENLWVGVIRNNPVFWLPAFLVGMSLTAYTGFWRRLGDRTATGIVLLLCSSVLFVTLATADNYKDLLIFGGLVPLLGFIILSFTHETSHISRLMGSRILSNLGRASYGLYIIQAPVWHYFRAALTYWHHRNTSADVVSPIAFVIFVASLIGLSLLLNRYVEKPCSKFLMSITERGVNGQVSLSYKVTAT